MGYDGQRSEDGSWLRQLARQNHEEGSARDILPVTCDEATRAQLAPVVHRMLRSISNQFAPLGYGIIIPGSLLHAEPDVRWVAALAEARRQASTPDAARRSIGGLIDSIIAEVAPHAVKYKTLDHDEWTRARRNVAQAAFTALSGPMVLG